MIYTIGYTILTIWIIGVLWSFAILMHEGLTHKDSKAFVRKWTDFGGICVYIVLSMVYTTILMIQFCCSPSNTIDEIKDTLSWSN